MLFCPRSSETGPCNEAYTWDDFRFGCELFMQLIDIRPCLVFQLSRQQIMRHPNLLSQLICGQNNLPSLVLFDHIIQGTLTPKQTSTTNNNNCELVVLAEIP